MGVVETAATQIGYHERPGNDTKYGREFGLNRASWCAIFVWWVYMKALGIDLRRLITPGWASVDTAWRAGARYRTKSPQPGDIVVYHFPREHAGGNHMGIFERDLGGSIVAIEGNTGGSDTHGGGVLRRTRSKSLVLGYLHIPHAAPAPTPAGDGGALARVAAAMRTIVGLAPNEIRQGPEVLLMKTLLNQKYGTQLDPPLDLTDDTLDARTQLVLMAFKARWGLSNPTAPACAADTWKVLAS